MMDLLKLILGVLASLFRSRAKLEAEILISLRTGGWGSALNFARQLPKAFNGILSMANS